MFDVSTFVFINFNYPSIYFSEPDMVLGKLNISKPEREALLANIHKKMAASPVKLRCRFNLKCFTFEGIDAIRESLLEAKAKTCDE
jgi:translation initiation factor 2 subunit 1